MALAPPPPPLPLRSAPSSSSAQPATDFMKSMGEWLRVSIHVQNVVPRIGLLSAEQQEIGSCRNSTSSFNFMENHGDQLVTLGRGRDFLRSLCRDAGWPTELGNRLAFSIVSNVEFGPIFATGLDLMRFFSAADRRSIRAES